jgi:PAS domain S-box-containing protein
MKIKGGIVGLVFTHTDITALKKTEAELKKRNKDLIELNEISAMLTKSTDLKDVYNISLNKVKEMFNASFVNVYLISGNTARLSGYAGEFTDDELESISRIDLIRSVMGEVFLSKAPVIITRELPRYQGVSVPWRKLIKKYNLQAGVNLPLIIQEKVLGTFNINFNYPRELNDQEIQFLALITNQLSAAIENTRLYENLRERMNDLTILASLGTIYASSLDINELTESVLDRITELRGPDTMVLALFNDKSRMMQVVSFRGIPDGAYDYSVDELHPAVRNILEIKQDLIIENITSEYPDLKEMLISRDQNSIGYFTLQAEGVVLGLLSVGFRRASKFPLEDVALYKSIATQLSMAIRNAQLYQQIQDSEEKYRLLVETAQDMVISMELDGTFTYISPSAEHLTGYSPQELLSHRLSPRMIHPSDFQYVNKLMRLAASREVPMRDSREVEFRIRIRSGGYRWISASYTLVHDARGNITGVQCILRDVHERRLAQEEITQQLQQQRVLYELAHNLAATLERKEILSAVSKSIHKILPYHLLTVYNYIAELPDELQRIMTVSAGTGTVIFDKPETVPLNEDEAGLEQAVLRDRCLHEGTGVGRDTYRIAAPMLMKDQVFGLLVIEADKKRVYSEVQKNLLQTIAHLASIAVEKSLLYEETVDKSLEIERRNRELDDFTYVVSHDLKEPLISIEGYSKILLADFSDSLRAEGQDLLSSIRQSSIRMKKLINELLELSRVGRMTESMQSVDINDILDEILEDLEYTINKKNVEFDIPANIPAVHGNRVHLVLLFRNLIVNAIKFNESPNPKISIGWREDDNMYRFSVADNGIGIPEEYFEKIFIIFHKLRSQVNVEGTGAGLTIVKKIIETHGGRIWLDSAVGKGTTFYITLQKEKR